MFVKDLVATFHTMCRPQRCYIASFLGSLVILGLLYKTTILFFKDTNNTLHNKNPVNNDKVEHADWSETQTLANSDLYMNDKWKRIAFGTKYFDTYWPNKPNWKFPDENPFKDCDYKNCVMVKNPKDAHLILFNGYDVTPEKVKKIPRNQDQIWTYLNHESPYVYYTYLKQFNSVFNWTCSYRLDSDIYVPYGFTQALTDDEQKMVDRTKNYANGRDKLAVVVSGHCTETQNRRWEFIYELKKYMDVDILGQCASFAGRQLPNRMTIPCVEQCKPENLAKHYKFYLSFENANCLDYISEKFWCNAFKANLVPVVLGGLSNDDYQKVAPPYSYISVHNFNFSAKLLAKYLLYLHQNDEKYNQYFQWKEKYKVHCYQENDFPCKICQTLHNKTKTSERKIITNLYALWNKEHHCVKSTFYYTGNGFMYYTSVALIFISIIMISVILKKRFYDQETQGKET